MKLRSCLMLGGAACLLLTANALFAQETEEAPATGDVVTEEVDHDPFASDAFYYRALGGRKISGDRGKAVRTTLRLRTETWEVSSIDLVRALDEGTAPELIEKWRGKMLGGGALMFAPVLVLDTGAQGTAESITEQIYPTEYEGCDGLGALPDPEGEEPSPAEKLVEAAGKFTVPTAFETRNTGTTLEASVQEVTAEEGTWDVLFSLEDVRLDAFAEFGDPALQVTMPTFTTYRSSGLIRVAEGKWQLVGAQPAPLGMKREPEGKSWVTLVRIDPAR